MLHELIDMNRDDIIRRCRVKLAGWLDPTAANAALDHDVPTFLDQLTDAVRDGSTSTSESGRGAIRERYGLPRESFSVSQVAHEYGEVCQAIAELAVELNAPLSAADVRTLNRCLDDAIASAVRQDRRDPNAF